MINFDSKQSVIEFIKDLHHNGMLYHFDELAEDCLDNNSIDTDILQAKVDEMLLYCNEHDLCPFELFFEHIAK